MKVLMLSTFAKTGGAAIAANRLMHALNSNGVHATMLSRQNMPLPLWKEKWGGLPFLKERACIWLANGMSTKNLFAIDIANSGDDVTKTKAFKNADVIHLHWINQGFLSLKTMERIIHSGKHVVWTMHDQWAMTGICHYSDECKRYETGCRCCPLLVNSSGKDIAERVFREKLRLYKDNIITFVTCSEWLGRIAKNSALGKGQNIVSIPNAIDTEMFQPINKELARKRLGLSTDAKLVLFGCQKITDERKGLTYLIEAMKELPDVGVVLVGGNTEETRQLMPHYTETICMGQINEASRMALIYAAVDVFVTPSLQDNLPNTIMEAMACGTPCVGFDVGGIPEMIEHKMNGYVAHAKDAEDLAQGIRYVLDNTNRHRLQNAARDKAIRCYSEDIIAQRYIEVYGRSLL